MRAASCCVAWVASVLLLGCFDDDDERRPVGTYTLRQTPQTTCAIALPATATLWVHDWLPEVTLDGIWGADVLVAPPEGDPANLRFAVMWRDPATTNGVLARYELRGNDHLEGTASTVEAYTSEVPCPHTVESQ